MRNLPFAAALWGLCVMPVHLVGQDTGPEDVEYREIPCPIGLNSTFADDYQPIPFGGHDFYTSWTSKLTSYPLPSWNWYRAIPDPDPISEDGTVRWEGAEILVHCWMERVYYVFVRHYDFMDAVGRIVPLRGPNDGTDEGGSCTDSTEFQESIDYDPFASSDTRPFDKCGSEAGSGEQSSAGAMCGGSTDITYDYVCIDVWDDRTGTWVEWWCGIVAICN